MLTTHILTTTSMTTGGPNATLEMYTLLMLQAERKKDCLIQKVKKKAEKRKFHDAFKGICPHCGKMQSWVAISFSNRTKFYMSAVFLLTMLIYSAISDIRAVELPYLSALGLSLTTSIFCGLIMVRKPLISRIRGLDLQNKEYPTIYWPEQKSSK